MRDTLNPHRRSLDDRIAAQPAAVLEVTDERIRESAAAELAEVQGPLGDSARLQNPGSPAPSEAGRIGTLETIVQGFDLRLKSANDGIESNSQALSDLGGRLDAELEKLDDVALRLDSLDTQTKQNGEALKQQKSWLEDNSTKLYEALVGIESAQEDLELMRRDHDQRQSAQAETNRRVAPEGSENGLLLPLLFSLLAPVALVVIQGGLHATAKEGTTKASPVTWVLVAWFAGGTAFFLVGIGIMYGPSYGGVIGNPGHFLSKLMLSAPADLPPEWLEQLVPHLVLASIVAIVACSSAPSILTHRGHFLVAMVAGGLVYPLFGHWIANPTEIVDQTGWLAGSALACPTATTDVALLGGILALALAYGLGLIRLQSIRAPSPSAMPASTGPATTGTLLLWVAWIGVILISNADCLPLEALAPSLAVATGGAAIGALLVDAATTRTFQWQNRLPFAVLAGVVAAPVDGLELTLVELAVLGALAGVSASLLIRYLDTRSTADTRLASSLLVGGIFGSLGPVVFGPAGLLFVHSIGVLAPQVQGMGVALLLGLVTGLLLAWPIGSARFLRRQT